MHAWQAQRRACTRTLRNPHGPVNRSLLLLVTDTTFHDYGALVLVRQCTSPYVAARDLCVALWCCCNRRPNNRAEPWCKMWIPSTTPLMHRLRDSAIFELDRLCARCLASRQSSSVLFCVFAALCLHPNLPMLEAPRLAQSAHQVPHKIGHPGSPWGSGCLPKARCCEEVFISICVSACPTMAPGVEAQRAFASDW